MPRKLANPAQKAAKAVIQGRKPPTALQSLIVSRIRTVQAEMQLTNEKMAELVGAGHSSWSNWTSLGNMPAEEAMIRLCEKSGVTMDWLYRGVIDGVKLGLAIRLTARMKGLDPDLATVSVLVEKDA